MKEKKDIFPIPAYLFTAALLLFLITVSLPVFRSQAKGDNNQIRIACVGDSITFGYTSSNRNLYSYPSQLQNLLGDGYTVGNYGRNSQTLLKNGDQSYWNTTEFTNSKNFNPDIVILMLGTNDSKSSNWTHKDEFLSYLKEMIQVYQELSSHPAVYVCTSPRMPVEYENMATRSGLSNRVINEEIVPLQKQAAQESCCKLIDVNAFSHTTLADDDFNDYAHPTDTGYQKLANFIYENLTCTCAIESLSFENGTVTIPWYTSHANITLNARCSVTPCPLDAHQNRTLTLTYALTDETEPASLKDNVLTVTGPGIVHVSVRAELSGTDIFLEENASFQVTKEEPPKTEETEKHVEDTEKQQEITPPPTPKITLSRPKLTAKKSGTKIKLSWKKDKKANGYILQMKAGKGKYKPIASKKGKVTSYTKKKLKKGNVYYFRMRSYRNSPSRIYSSWSKPVKVRL